MMTNEQLEVRLGAMVEKLIEYRPIQDDTLILAIIDGVERFMKVFGYDDIPKDFIKVGFIHDSVEITLNKKYLKDGLIVI